RGPLGLGQALPEVVVHDEGEPEAQLAEADRLLLDVDAVERVLDDLVLEVVEVVGPAGGIGLLEDAVEDGACTDDLVEHADDEGAGADGGVADAHGLEGVVPGAGNAWGNG